MAEKVSPRNLTQLPRLGRSWGFSHPRAPKDTLSISPSRPSDTGPLPRVLGQPFLGVQYMSTHCTGRYEATLSAAWEPIMRMAVSKHIVRAFPGTLGGAALH